MNTEKKYIIVKVYGKLKHYKSDREDHIVIARHHHCQDINIVERGLLIDGTLEVWECYDKEHLRKLKTRTPDKWLGKDIEDYQEELRRKWWLK